MSEAIYLTDLFKAASALGLTNAQIAARLGLTAAVFNRMAELVKNGWREPITSKSGEYAAASRLIEEANRINGASPQSTRDTHKQAGKGATPSAASAANGTGKQAGRADDRADGRTEHADEHVDAEHAGDQVDDRRGRSCRRSRQRPSRTCERS